MFAITPERSEGEQTARKAAGQLHTIKLLTGYRGKIETLAQSKNILVQIRQLRTIPIPVLIGVIKTTNLTNSLVSVRSCR